MVGKTRNQWRIGSTLLLCYLRKRRFPRTVLGELFS